MSAYCIAAHPGQAIAAYRDDTAASPQLFMIPTRRCRACGNYRGLTGSKQTRGHFYCRDCARALNPRSPA
jgi:late competence protein required for DNA uptake (superfamily II DNA/RNA helicase)